MYQIIREIHFSYGHRILNHPGKCARLHGHNARVQIELAAEALNDQGMVMDFYDVKRILGTWIDEALDHRMLLDPRDPLAEKLMQAGEPVVLTPYPPTAEGFARWIFEEAKKRGLPVSKVTFWETPSSAASYEIT